MQVGLQFHLPSHPALTVPEIVDLGRLAADGGVRQLWVTDNLGSRNAFVVLAALASNVEADLGTAIMVQYFRNPVDAADSLAAVTEIMRGELLSVGIGRGNVRTPRFVETPRPVSMMRETAQALRRLFDGGDVTEGEFPNLASYYQYAPDAVFRLKFPPARPIHVLCGGDGPKSLAIGGAHMDGLLCGTTFQPIEKMGYLDSKLRVFDEAAAGVGRREAMDKVVEIKIALTRERSTSREFARRGVGSRVLGLRWRGYGVDDLARLGISEADVDRLEQAKATSGGTSQELGDLVTDPMIDAFYIAGDLGYCRERVQEICETAENHGFRQLLFSGISPDFVDGVQLLCQEIVPLIDDRTT